MDPFRTAFFMQLTSVERIEKLKEQAEIMSCPFVDLSRIDIQRDISSFLPENIARKNRVLLIEKDEDILTIAVKDPNFIYVLDTFKGIWGDKYKYEVVYCDPVILLSALDYTYGEGERKVKSSLSWTEYLHFLKGSSKRVTKSSLMEKEDIMNWPSLIRSLKESKDGIIQWMVKKLDKESKDIIQNWSSSKFPDDYEISILLNGINNILDNREFYNREVFQKFHLNEEAQKLYDKGLADLDIKEIQRFNRILFELIFPQDVMMSETGQEVALKEQEKPPERVIITGPIEEIVNNLIGEAIVMDASDIHVEQQEDYVLIRFRIYGYLQEIKRISKEDGPSVLARIKIMANMDLAECRMPHGGRISIKKDNKDYDLRVSIVPTPNGENCVMRILSKSNVIVNLESLGFQPDDLANFNKLLECPNGIILVTGPTGSGKTTTLYAALNGLNRPDVKILTIEDPVEYQLQRITHVQVNLMARAEEKKLTFARALREFLRQDPDIIMVGEIRDTETASIATQAALTGHLLLSTIHTNDSIGVIMRLEDMGIEPFLINATLEGAIAQRLVRKLCPNCKRQIATPDEMKQRFIEYGIEVPANIYAKGQGCMNCNKIGYKGRSGIYEVFTVTDEIREMVRDKASKRTIMTEAVKGGFKPLFVDGLHKVADGITTYAEVRKSTLG